MPTTESPQDPSHISKIPTWVASDQDLAALCQQLQQQTAIALDTEFARSRTYYPHIGLLQIADQHGIYLVDPLSIEQRQPFADILTNPKIIKVVHSASEDLEVFQHAFGVLPQALFDTQIAAALTGFGPSIGYANLLRELKSIDIPKQETRSDWLQRPLSEAQIKYAMLDVAHLLEIYEILVSRLNKCQRLTWAEADSAAMVEKLRQSNHPETYYQRVKLAWKLKPRQLAVLKKLCYWREQQARHKDVPRNRIVKDNFLYDIAWRLPRNSKQLQSIRGIPSSVLASSAEQWLAIVEEVLGDDNDVQYPPRLPGPLSTAQTHILKQLKATVAEIAQSLDVPQELLARKKDYTELMHSQNHDSGYQLPPSLNGWRQSVVGDALLACLESCAAQPPRDSSS